MENGKWKMENRLEKIEDTKLNLYLVVGSIICFAFIFHFPFSVFHCYTFIYGREFSFFKNEGPQDYLRRNRAADCRAGRRRDRFGGKSGKYHRRAQRSFRFFLGRILSRKTKSVSFERLSRHHCLHADRF